MDDVVLLLGSGSCIVLGLLISISLMILKKDAICKAYPNIPLLCKRNPAAKKSTYTQTSRGSRGNGAAGETVISFYGQSKGDDNGEGVTGVNLFKMDGLTFNGKPVYPVAVHNDNAAQFLYKVLEITGQGIKPIQGIVVDLCDRNDSSCSNKNKLGKNFLIDIHRLGFKAAGKDDGLVAGKYKVIGEIKPNDLPQKVWNKGANTYVMCRCTGRCDESSRTWKKVGRC